MSRQISKATLDSRLFAAISESNASSDVKYQSIEFQFRTKWLTCKLLLVLACLSREFVSIIRSSAASSKRCDPAPAIG